MLRRGFQSGWVLTGYRDGLKSFWTHCVVVELALLFCFFFGRDELLGSKTVSMCEMCGS